MTSKRARKSENSIRTLRAKGLTAKKEKRVKGGVTDGTSNTVFFGEIQAFPTESIKTYKR